MTLSLDELQKLQDFRDTMHLMLLHKSDEKTSWLNGNVSIEYLYHTYNIQMMEFESNNRTEQLAIQYAKAFALIYTDNANQEERKKHLIHLANFTMRIRSRL